MTATALASETSMTGVSSNGAETLLLVGIIQGLISYIYLTGQSYTNAKVDHLSTLVEKLFEESNKKLDKTDHEILTAVVNEKLDKRDHDRICKSPR
jgi:hypothetical protein